MEGSDLGFVCLLSGLGWIFSGFCHILPEMESSDPIFFVYWGGYIAELLRIKWVVFPDGWFPLPFLTKDFTTLFLYHKAGSCHHG
jgi:hypothetical protein